MDQFEFVNLEKKPQGNKNNQRGKQNIRQNKNDRNRNRRIQRDNQPFKKQRKQWRFKDQQRQNRPFQSENRIVATGKKRRQQQQQQRKFNQRPKVPRNIQPNVIIQGLDPKMTEAGLQEACKDFGPMNMCKLDRDNFGQVKPEGIGLVRFTRVEDAKACVEKLDGVTVQIIGENNNEKVISATFVSDTQQTENNRNRGVLNITKRPIKKRNWTR